MKSIEKRFKQFEKDNPFWSSYLCFANAVMDQKFSEKIIDKWIHLINKDDYKGIGQTEALRYLHTL